MGATETWTFESTSPLISIIRPTASARILVPCQGTTSLLTGIVPSVAPAPWLRHAQGRHRHRPLGASAAAPSIELGLTFLSLGCKWCMLAKHPLTRVGRNTVPRLPARHERFGASLQSSLLALSRSHHAGGITWTAQTLHGDHPRPLNPSIVFPYARRLSPSSPSQPS